MATVARDSLNLANNISALGAQPVKDWLGGEGIIYAEATSWNGATVTLEVASPRDTMITVSTTTTFTANGVANFDLPKGDIRVNVTGTAPTNLYVNVRALGCRKGN